jgi:L,D-transpeptidase YbiS
MLIAVFLYVTLIQVPVYQEKSIIKTSQSLAYSDSNRVDSAKLKKELALVKKAITRLDAKIDNFVPKSNYILINTTSNEFYLYKHKKLIRKGRCSTGSYTLLTSGNNKQWIFKTPKGKFFIHGKTTDPVWIKPDWAFVEEGLPIPAKNHPSRYEYGVLGDYALSLGQGYLIHGTLYKRFLGMPVTHGCIRLNDDDLDIVYHTLEVGSRVYIY